jgi:membrane protein
VTDERPSAIARLKSGATERWAALRARYALLRHVVDAYGLLQRNNGNQYAAAITYFSFLALFPLLLLAVAVTGYVLVSHPATQASLFHHVTQKVPGEFGQTLQKSLQSAIDKRAGVGVVGLAGVLLSGLGWIANLRGAIDGVWGRSPAKRSFLKAKTSDLLVLAGLGLGIVVSLGLTVVGTSVTTQILRAVSLDDVPGFTLLLKVIGIVLAVAGDMVIFWWVLIKLPQADVPRRVAVKGALLASVGFEVLKVVGTYTIAHTAKSPTLGPFAGILAVLIWIQLVARFMLFSCAWTATVAAESKAAAQVPMELPAIEGAGPTDSTDGPTVRPATVGATLVGAGALAGAVATWAATRPKPPAGARPKPSRPSSR